jgi:hypothetical protein
MVKYSRTGGWDSELVEKVETRAYRAGLVAGALSLIALLGAVKDLYAVLKPSGRGQLVLGFLMLRYTRLERVWFGYRFTGRAAFFATLPHVLVYAAVAYGLITRRRWGWYLAFAYILYIPLSELTFAFLYPLGWLTGHPYNASIVRAEWFFMLVSLPLELLALGFLWWYRDLFVR